jgi:hypothetical protein
VWEDVRLDFMQKCIEETLAQLPDIYGWQVKKDDRGDWHRLTRSPGQGGLPCLHWVAHSRPNNTL